MENSEKDTNEKLAEYDRQIEQVKAQQRRLAAKLEELMDAKEKLKESVMIEQGNNLAKKDWLHSNFKWSNIAKDVLVQKFKKKSFRHQQLACVNAILSGCDCILLMPTGGGKSLCYQLPALVTEGITLVVSPLVSLMEDQVMALKQLNINAEFINSNSGKELVKRVHDALSNGSSPLKIIYVTPERMAKSKRFMACLQKCYMRKALDRIAIDEVHCCSQWGHDFRPDYKYLGVLKSMFPEAPILGLTATATTRILVDVQKMLNISGCLLLRASFNRQNLYYEVRVKPSAQLECLDLLEDLLKNKYNGKSGIIYTTSIRDSTEIMTGLRERGLRVGCYHAELDAELRSKVHKKWYDGSYQAVIATVAFGMGIDKPDVRFVIHHSLPKSVENFYQESGRAGRDDLPADCILFYRLADVTRLSTMVFSTQMGLSNLYSMVEYCIDAERCRRTIIGKFFDEEWTERDCNKMCDHCKNNLESREVDITKHCRDIFGIMQQAADNDVRLTPIKLLDAWFQKGDKKLRLSNIKVPAISKITAENIVAFLLLNDYLKEDYHYTAYSTISYIKRGSKANNVLQNMDYKIIMKVSNRTCSSSSKAIKRTTSNENKDTVKKQKVITID